jgi:glycosyltransferase involved in cell wall biosynthesis
VLRRQTLGVVPLAVPIPERPPVPREERSDAVLVLSRLCEAKGPDVALRACRAAGVPMVLAGPVGGQSDRAALEAALADPASPVADYPDVRWFLQHVAPLLDDDRARWIGSVSGEEKDELLRSSRAVLFPIRWPEPGGTAVCEAQAAGTPVVAHPLGCLPSLVEDGVTGFLAENEEAFAAALRRLDEIDPAACARVSTAHALSYQPPLRSPVTLPAGEVAAGASSRGSLIGPFSWLLDPPCRGAAARPERGRNRSYARLDDRGP